MHRFSGSMGGSQHGSAAKRLKDTYDYSRACAVDDHGTEKVTLDDNKITR